MKASTIQTFGISREFNGITVLNDINLALESGKIYGLIGRNGSGKTVLMKIICGFLYAFQRLRPYKWTKTWKRHRLP